MITATNSSDSGDYTLVTDCLALRHRDWSSLSMLQSDWLILLLQIHKTLWHEILKGGSSAVDQPCDGGALKSRARFLDGSEVCSTPHNSAEVSNRSWWMTDFSCHRIVFWCNSSCSTVVVLQYCSRLVVVVSSAGNSCGCRKWELTVYSMTVGRFNMALPYLALPPGCYNCPALKPYLFNPMCIPECNHGCKAVDGCEAIARRWLWNWNQR